jgi:hypothetical protein
MMTHSPPLVAEVIALDRSRALVDSGVAAAFLR